MAWRPQQRGQQLHKGSAGAVSTPRARQSARFPSGRRRSPKQPPDEGGLWKKARLDQGSRPGPSLPDAGLAKGGGGGGQSWVRQRALGGVRRGRPAPKEGRGWAGGKQAKGGLPSQWPPEGGRPSPRQHSELSSGRGSPVTRLQGAESERPGQVQPCWADRQAGDSSVHRTWLGAPSPACLAGPLEERHSAHAQGRCHLYDCSAWPW